MPEVREFEIHKRGVSISVFRKDFRPLGLIRGISRECVTDVFPDQSSLWAQMGFCLQ